MAAAEALDLLADYPRAELDAAARHVESVWTRLQGARLFVTGGTGFLGRWLIALLIHANDTRGLGLHIACLSRDPARFRAGWPDLASHPAVSLIAGDVRSFEAPGTRYTHVIHGAADTSAAAGAAPFELLDAIVGGTRRVLELARASDAVKLLFISSGAVYGRQPTDIERIPETYPGAPLPTDARSTYGEAKRLAEHLCALQRQYTGIQTTIARCFAFAGPGLPMDGHFAIGNFIRDAVAGKMVRVAGDGSPLRSYLHGSDTATWLIKILADGHSGEAYNVGSDQAISIRDLAQRVASQLTTDGKIEVLGQSDGKDRSRYVPDITKARGLGLEVWTDLNQQIASTAEWYRREVASRAS